MKAEVISSFHDRLDPSSCYSVGDVYEGDEERIIELADGGYVVAIEEPAPKPKPKRTTRKPKPKE